MGQFIADVPRQGRIAAQEDRHRSHRREGRPDRRRSLRSGQKSAPPANDGPNGQTHLSFVENYRQHSNS